VFELVCAYVMWYSLREEVGKIRKRGWEYCGESEPTPLTPERASQLKPPHTRGEHSPLQFFKWFFSGALLEAILDSLNSNLAAKGRIVSPNSRRYYKKDLDEEEFFMFFKIYLANMLIKVGNYSAEKVAMLEGVSVAMVTTGILLFLVLVIWVMTIYNTFWKGVELE
jgi:hypothetical protein